MSHFANKLQIALEKLGWTRAHLSEVSAVPTSTLHTYFHGTRRPELDNLERICAVLPDHWRAELCIAHLRDETPPSAAALVQILNIAEGTRVQETPPAYGSTCELPESLQRAFQRLMKRAEKDPTIGPWIIGTVDLLEGE